MFRFKFFFEWNSKSAFYVKAKSKNEAIEKAFKLRGNEACHMNCRQVDVLVDAKKIKSVMHGVRKCLK